MIEIYAGQSPIPKVNFQFETMHVPHFIAHHNVNYPPFRMTERSIELALADIFLDQYPRDKVLEIGATTPYYWPHRIKNIVDPTDKHRLVSIKKSFMDIEIGNYAILSISTFEHIGIADYGLAADKNIVSAALAKLLAECSDFLVTIPGGYNPAIPGIKFSS